MGLIEFIETNYIDDVTVSRFKSMIGTIKGFVYARYNRDDVPLSEIDREFCDDFIRYLDAQNYSISTLINYKIRFRRFCTYLVINKKIKWGCVDIKNKLLDTIKTEYVLTDDDIEKLTNYSDVYNEDIRRFCLFLAHSGIDFSSANNLKWKDVYTNENGFTFVRIKKQDFLLNSQALRFLPNRVEGGNVFTLNTNKFYYKAALLEWSIRTKVNKIICFERFEEYYQSSRKA